MGLFARLLMAHRIDIGHSAKSLYHLRKNIFGDFRDMEMLNDIHINFGAFALSGLLAFALGLVWYHPKVMRGGGIDLLESQKKVNFTPLTMVASLFLWILSACFYAFLAYFLEVNSAAGYFCLSCLLWVAFAMPPTLMSALYTGNSIQAMAIDAGYQLGGYYIFAAVHIVFLQMGWM